jgi:hypothetical protein
MLLVTFRSLKSGTKFFDALGRVYEEMKIRLAYYIFKDAVQKNERDITLEFEVWARIIEDAEGNDIQAFIKEDKRNGLRRDSSFYYDGSWEIFEKEPSVEECNERVQQKLALLNDRWNEWYKKEQAHANSNSPKYERIIFK